MDEVQSLARGLRILDLIAAADRGVGVTELAGALGIDKSSASRLVRTLANQGYLQAEPGTRRYVLGRRLYQLGWAALDVMPVRALARPYLERLVAQTGECAHTAVYAEGRALVIDDVEAETTLRVVSGTGRMIPLHCTAVGKALLAFADVPRPAALPAFTPRTLTDPAALEAHLADTRARGYALDDEEYDAGIRCIAAPITNRFGIVTAVIGISGPALRLTDAHVPALAAAVMESARALSTETGFTGG